MIKMIVGLFVGILFTGLLYNVGILSLTPIMAQSEESSLAKTLPDTAASYHEALISPLQKAGEEIKDREIAQYYQKLQQEYELDKPSSEITPTEHSSLTEMLPDIKKINHAALTLPLQEAGKNIQDKEIAQFYYKLLKNAGWTIESN